jgi:hypothetical protein
MEQLKSLAKLSVGRACFFAGLGILTAMVGFITDPMNAMRIGAALVSITACVLLIKAHNAPRRPFRQTELWLMLDSKIQMADERAQRLIGGVLAETYDRYARYAMGIAVVLWIIAVAGEFLWPDLAIDGY